eukprot:12897178-Prorocentrum_lima.AAC.1
MGTYWSKLAENVLGVLKRLVVNHHGRWEEPAHTAAEQLLRLTYCEDKGPEALQPRRRQLVDEVLDRFNGDWRAHDVIPFKCRTPDCAGGPACRQRAVLEAYS